MWRLLLDYNVDVNAKDGWGATALHVAAHPGTAELLKASGGSQNGTSLHRLLHILAIDIAVPVNFELVTLLNTFKDRPRWEFLGCRDSIVFTSSL